jgi:site-specific DNA-methyltransferase (adenine-specific)
MRNRTLYFGDNLEVLRTKFPPNDAGYFDLVYLDPPFNSKATYNVLFKEGVVESQAQVAAFEDTWHWTREAQAQFEELISDPRYPQRVSDCMQGLMRLVGHNDLMAYLTMMTVRLVELHRVLKQTGSLYLHCDPTASHYLKVVLDTIFGARAFTNELVWRRSLPHGNQSRKYGASHDTIFFYKKTPQATWNGSFLPHRPEYLTQFYKYRETDGRVYRLISCINPNPNRPNLTYEWNGVTRVWKYTRERMQRMHDEGLLVCSKSGIPSYKGYLDMMRGTPTQDIWDDIYPLMGSEAERLGYPTQKPVALLERIIQASTNEGDWVLDPFGGCGTTVVAAESLGRNWVMIDVTTLAINLVRRRLEETYPDRALAIAVDGLPADLAGARELAARDKFEFEYWCCDLVNARPSGSKAKGKMRGADRGIDGIITLVEPKAGGQTVYHRVLVQVKGGEHLPANVVRDLEGTRSREGALGAVLVSLTPPTKAMQREAAEAGSFTYELTGQKYPRLQLLTVDELVDGHRPRLPNVLAYAKQAAPTSSQAPEPTLTFE